jgi:signal transduction histidine kinase
MHDQNRKQLRIATIVFWVLLLYIVAALLWWLISLEQQNTVIHNLKKSQSVSGSAVQQNLKSLDNARRRNSIKHITEGIAFLILVIFGAVYIYRLVRRQFQLQQQQQNFIMAITHELKTPISVAQLNLETLQKHHLDEEKQKKLMNMTLEETRRLDVLINNILITTQLDGLNYTTSKEDLDLSSLMIDSINNFKNRYPSKTVHAEIEDLIDFTGDELLLKLLISNLLENANKYGPRESPVYCELVKMNNKIKLAVTDEGIGIHNEEKRKVFQKFYRVGNEQVRKTKGTGLGLYICKKIVKAHNGSIVLSDNLPQGSTFTITFPVK